MLLNRVKNRQIEILTAVFKDLAMSHKLGKVNNTQYRYACNDVLSKMHRAALSYKWFNETKDE